MSVNLLIGLGNPGRKYLKTRHNVGFLVVDRLANKFGFEIKKKKFKSKFELTKLFDKDVCVVKPETFMNLSGEAVDSFLNYYKSDFAHMLVVHDDIDLELGTIKMSFASGHAGHNGIRSIHDWVESRNYYRLRVGVGRPPEPIDPADYVLTAFDKGELSVVDEVVEKAVDVIETFYREGFERAREIL